MRKILAALAAVVSTVAFAATASAAPGTGAHIVGDLSVDKSLVTGLTVSGKGAGFGNAVTDAFLTADSVTAEWQCRNHGGNIAPGQGTELVDVTGPTQSITPRQGQITFSVNLPVPAAPDPDVACPNGNWTIDSTPLSLTYTNVVLHFDQNGQEVLDVELGTL